MQKIFNFVDTDQHKYLKPLILFSLFFHIIAVIFTEGFHRPDEHLGMLRMSLYKLGFFDVKELSWEIPAQIRSFLQPGIYAAIIKVSSFLGINNPFMQSFILRLFSSLLGFLSILLLANLSRDFLKDKKAIILSDFALFTLWFLPFFHARTTTENLGISFFIFSLYFYLKNKSRFLTGLLLGLSIFFRFQMGVCVAFLILWSFLFKRETIKNYIGLFLGIIAVIILNTIVDYWGYGEWTFSPWNYIYQNIFKGVASGFGTSPWYYYITKSLAKGVPPLSMLGIISFFIFWFYFPKHILTWITLPYFIIHSGISHKELRFILAITLFIPLILGILYQDIDKYKKIFSSIRANKFMITLSLLLSLVSSTKNAYGPIDFYKTLYNEKETISKVYTLGVVRDKLKFYLQKPIDFQYIEKKDSVLKQKNLWILSVNYKDYLDLKLRDKCDLKYISYPEWVLEINIGKWRERSKIWALFRCN